MKGPSALVAAAALLMSTNSTADSPPIGILTVRVSQLRSSDGQVGCMIYNAARGFPTDPSAALQRHWCAIVSGASACVFDPLPAGTYAVACFHDENKNGKLDTGLFGIPTEVRARVESLDELSGHADNGELLTWMKPMTSTLKRVFLVHGEGNEANALARAIRERYGIEAAPAAPGQSFDL